MADKDTILVPVKLVRAYWPGEDERREAGLTVEVDPKEARRLITLGIAERMDPLPGE